MIVFTVNIFVFVICIVENVSEEITNKLDLTTIDVKDLQRNVWYRRKDVVEIREIISSIPYFKAIGGDDYKKYDGWYQDNINNFNERRRNLDSIKEKLMLSTSYFNSTKQSIKNLQELDETGQPRFLLSTGPRWGNLTTRLYKLGENVALVRAVADDIGGALRDEMGKFTYADHRLQEAKAILGVEERAAEDRADATDDLEQRSELLEKRFSNIKEKAEEILTQITELGDKIKSVEGRTSITETKIREYTDELQMLSVAGVPVPVPSASSSGGLNYIKSVKTASGRGKRIKLIVLSD